MGSVDEMADFLPPPGPPPLLNIDQLEHLAVQGWLILPNTSPATHGQASHPMTTTQNSLGALFPLLPPFFAPPPTTKKALYPSKQGTELGYYNVAKEKEYLSLRCRSHPDNDLENAAADVWRSASALFNRILHDLATGLGVDNGVWDDLLEGTDRLPDSESEMSSGTLLRMFRYEAGEGFAGVHTDLGLLTLCVGNRAGLQVLDRPFLETTGEENWIDVQAGQMVVLAGQTLKALTQGSMRAGIHRVVASEETRNSVVFALRHSWKHDIDLSRFGGEGTLEAKRLWEALKIGVVNINAGKKRREMQRSELDRLRANVDGGGHG